MIKEVDFYHLESDDAKMTAYEMEKRLGIKVAPLVLGEHSNINPSRGFIVFNGDGYLHHLTRSIVRDLLRKRDALDLPPFSYVRIDGHDDMAAMYDGDDNSYKSFVLGVIKDNNGGVYFLEEGLTGKRDDMINFLTPKVNEQTIDWGPRTQQLRDGDVYVSIDFDVLDVESGIHHLFPQTPTGFDISRLVWNLEELSRAHNFLGVDLVGFSTQGATKEYIEKSLDNIARLADKLVHTLTTPTVTSSRERT